MNRKDKYNNFLKNPTAKSLGFNPLLNANDFVLTAEDEFHYCRAIEQYLESRGYNSRKINNLSCSEFLAEHEWDRTTTTTYDIPLCVITCIIYEDDSEVIIANRKEDYHNANA